VTTHYDVLGVRSSATAEQIKRAYYRKARTYHPDAHAGSTAAVLDEAERSMAAVNAAWNVLRDAQLRTEYDRALEQSRTAKGARRRRRSAAEERIPPLEIGSGFSYWMGASAVVRGTDGTGVRVNLTVDTARDLTPLRNLAPDGICGLHAGGADIDDAQLVHIGELTGLQLLDLSNTAITDAGLLHLGRLEHLEHLWLWGTGITDAGLALVGRLQKLRLLGLGNTGVTDAGLAGLAGLTNLRVLQLVGTQVVGHGLEHLHGLLDLERVSLPWRVRGRHRRRLKAALPYAAVA
jgi:DnaJ-domain-containing protein 1